MNDERIDLAGEYILYILIAIYSFVFLVLLLFCIRVLLKPRWNIVKVLICELPWPILARDINFVWNVVQSDHLTGSVSDQQSVGEIFVSGLPGYMLFSIFLLLVLFWVYLAHNLDMENFKKKMIISYILINIFVYYCWFALLMFMLLFPPHLEIIHQVEGVYAASLNLVVALAFFFFGIKLLIYIRASRKDQVYIPLDFITKRVIHTYLIIILPCCILTLYLHSRSIWIVLNEFYFNEPLTNLIGAVGNDLLGEVLPILTILIICVWPTKNIEKSLHQREKGKLQHISS